MERLGSRYAIGICTASLIFTGCGGSQAQLGTPATVAQTQSTGGHPRRADWRGTPDATTTTAFTVSGRKMFVTIGGGSEQLFFIKGVDYGNAQIDQDSDPNPLDNKNEEVWKPDLDAMCAGGVNAVKVYNVTLSSFKPYESIIGGYNTLRPYESGKIDKFLNAAWNCPQHIYVVLSVFFGAVNVNQPGYLKALKAVYGLMVKEYASYPAFMGVSLGSEINSKDYIVQPAWWKGLNEISQSVEAAYKVSKAEKIITTTMVDDGLETVRAGEKNGFKIDAWGLDVYRSPTLGAPNDDVFKQIKRDTAKPAIIAEYGSSAAYYPTSSATHGASSEGKCQNYPPGSDKKPYYGLPPPRPWEDATELPDSGNPAMSYLVDYVTGNQNAIYDNSTINGGVASGGFYFEWNDEWWKSGWSHKHIGGLEGNVIAVWAEGAGCYKDEAWFGLNSDKPVDRIDEWEKWNPYPARPPDERVPRPTLKAIEALWAKQ
jgi:hypothetical protein